MSRCSRTSTDSPNAALELDGVDLADVATISGRGAPAMAAWATAREGLRMVDVCHNGVTALAGLAHIAITRDRRPVIYTPAGAADLDRVQADTNAYVTVWTAAKAGLPLALCDSMACLVERLARFGEQRAAAAAAVEQRPKPALA